MTYYEMTVEGFGLSLIGNKKIVQTDEPMALVIGRLMSAFQPWDRENLMKFLLINDNPEAGRFTAGYDGTVVRLQRMPQQVIDGIEELVAADILAAARTMAAARLLRDWKDEGQGRYTKEVYEQRVELFVSSAEVSWLIDRSQRKGACISVEDAILDASAAASDDWERDRADEMAIANGDHPDLMHRPWEARP